jgi:lysophospholipase L1-like esterase
VRGRYITSDEGIRRTWQPEVPDGVEPVEVWFFGGSTTWGEGQRDLHTMPSEVARIAADHGLYLRAVNMGERGYNAFQEFLLLSQRLDELGPPDLAVFFDGHNEWGTRLEDPPSPIEQPAIYQYATVRDAFERAPAQPGVPPVAEPSIRRNYVEVSFLHKLLRHLGTIATVPAADAQIIPRPPPTEREVRFILDVFRRSVDLTALIADRHAVPLVRFWQPTRQGIDVAPLDDDLPPGVIDIQQAFEGVVTDEEAVFIDGGHTNEVGSRLAAEAMWLHLEPVLERLAAGR